MSFERLNGLASFLTSDPRVSMRGLAETLGLVEQRQESNIQFVSMQAPTIFEPGRAGSEFRMINGQDPMDRNSYMANITGITLTAGVMLSIDQIGDIVDYLVRRAEISASYGVGNGNATQTIDNIAGCEYPEGQRLWRFLVQRRSNVPISSRTAESRAINKAFRLISNLFDDIVERGSGGTTAWRMTGEGIIDMSADAELISSRTSTRVIEEFTDEDMTRFFNREAASGLVDDVDDAAAATRFMRADEIQEALRSGGQGDVPVPPRRPNGRAAGQPLATQARRLEVIGDALEPPARSSWTMGETRPVAEPAFTREGAGAAEATGAGEAVIVRNGARGCSTRAAGAESSVARGCAIRGANGCRGAAGGGTGGIGTAIAGFIIGFIVGAEIDAIIREWIRAKEEYDAQWGNRA